ncbi:MAG: hypothetical protein EU535_01995 [Promethearchaeota archaeon]|nr:MAG: hypothetical protein EU535_01995 [Candidatus Lokiarchaeota archaeon]
MSLKLEIKEFFVDFGNKILYYIFIFDYIIASWVWIDTYPSVDFFTKIKLFLSVLPIVFLPSLTKLVLKNTEKREDSIRLFDVIYGIFIWILSLIISSTQFNVLSLIAVIIILYITYLVVSVISWYYHPKLILRLIIPFIIINILVVFYLIRIYSEGLEYYRTINIIEFAIGIFVFILVGFLFLYNEITELLYIFHL